MAALLAVRLATHLNQSVEEPRLGQVKQNTSGPANLETDLPAQQSQVLPRVCLTVLVRVIHRHKARSPGYIPDHRGRYQVCSDAGRTADQVEHDDQVTVRYNVLVGIGGGLSIRRHRNHTRPGGPESCMCEKILPGKIKIGHSADRLTHQRTRTQDSTILSAVSSHTLELDPRSQLLSKRRQYR